MSENSTGNENIVLKLFVGYQLEYYAYVARVFVCAAAGRKFAPGASVSVAADVATPPKIVYQIW